jgi:tetratricopeptide (TPR) repeat protein
MTRLPRLLLVSALAVTTLVPVVRPATAVAADDEDAARARGRKFFKRADKLFNLGRFDEALEDFQQAYQEYPAPEILFNIGQCHRNLGNYDEAIFSFKKFLKLKPDADNREAVESYIAELEAEKARHKPADDEPDEPPELVPPPAPAAASPFYTRWWFWTGAAVVLGGAAATYVILSQEDNVPSSDLPPLEWPR